MGNCCGIVSTSGPVFTGTMGASEVAGPATDASEDAVLADCTDKNTPLFLPEVNRAKVLSVYDGDTVTVAARISRQGQAWKWKVRLNGIDAPEMRGGTEATKAAAKKSRDALRVSWPVSAPSWPRLPSAVALPPYLPHACNM